MKFRVTMKDPDTLYEAIGESVKGQIEEQHASLDADEKESLRETRTAKIRELCSKWFEYGEYLTVEIDTDAGTCSVVEKGR